jgi:hypothetical protein
MDLQGDHYSGNCCILAIIIKALDKCIKIEILMIKPQRRGHYYAWIILALLLPAGIVFAWLAISNAEPVKWIKSSNSDLLPLIKSSSRKKEYCVSLRTDKNYTQWQLEWENITPLTVPTAVIYRMPSRNALHYGRQGNRNEGGGPGSTKIEDGILVGRIEARGSYVFPINLDYSGNQELNLILYDFIHQQIVDTINLAL